MPEWKTDPKETPENRAAIDQLICDYADEPWFIGISTFTDDAGQRILLQVDAGTYPKEDPLPRRLGKAYMCVVKV